MSEQLEEAYNALLNNRVPKAWEACNYSSISLLVERLHGKVCNSAIAQFPLQFSSQRSDVRQNSTFTKIFATFMFGLFPRAVSS